MKCFCSPDVADCQENGQKECPPEVSHCYVVLKWDRHFKTHVDQIRGCWLWQDSNACSDQPGPCHTFQESPGLSKLCCCKGSLCNNSSDAQFATALGLDTQNVSVFDQQSDPVSVSSDLNYRGISHGSTVNVWVVLTATPVVVLLILLLCYLLLYFNRSRLSAVRLRKRFGASDANHPAVKPFGPHSAAICTCGHMSSSSNQPTNANGLTDSQKFQIADTGWPAEGEILGISSMVTKVELKSQGCFGQVWLGRLTPCDQVDVVGEVDVAIKIFRAVQKDSWETELSLFRAPALAHPNILKFYGADKVINQTSEIPETELWIVTAFHPLGSLHDYLVLHTISWGELLRIADGIARGLSHLHSESTNFGDTDLSSGGTAKPCIAHRDLNSRNILLKSDLSACIADFGLAIKFEPGLLPSVAHPQLGTRRYMAPEVLDGAIQFSRDAYLRIDVYAMGLVFWELMSRCCGEDDYPLEAASSYRAPFEVELGLAPTIQDLLHFVAYERKRPQFNPIWTNYPCLCTIWETVEECWDQDAEARLSAGCVVERLATLSRQAWSARPSNETLTSDSQFVRLYPPSIASSAVSHCQVSESKPLLAFEQPMLMTSLHRSTGPGRVHFPVPSTSISVAAERIFSRPTIPSYCAPSKVVTDIHFQ